MKNFAISLSEEELGIVEEAVQLWEQHKVQAAKLSTLVSTALSSNCLDPEKIQEEARLAMQKGQFLGQREADKGLRLRARLSEVRQRPEEFQS